MSVTTTAPATWIDGTEAARRLDVSRFVVARLIRRGLIRERGLPGVRARLSAADVERLASAPATAPKDPRP